MVIACRTANSATSGRGTNTPRPSSSISRRVPAWTGGRAAPSLKNATTSSKGASRRNLSVSASETKEALKNAMDMQSDLKDALKAEIEGANSRPAITDLLLALEAKNPTSAPTESDLLTGSWKFAYNGGIAPGPVPSPTRPIALAMYAGGFSPGTFGLAVASMIPEDLIKTSDFKLCIEGLGPFSCKASIIIEALGRKVPVVITTNIVPESDRRIKETYKSVEVSGNATEVPASLQYERVMFITYLDEDIMISRDDSGAADVLFRIPSEDEEAAKEEMERIMKENDPTDAIKNAADDAAEAFAGVVGAMDNAVGEAADQAAEDADEAAKDVDQAVAGVIESIDSAAGDATDAVATEGEEEEADKEEGGKGKGKGSKK